MSEARRPARVLVVDAVRGAAVICMIQWHCADAWVRHPERDGFFFELTRIVGGFAAPLFLLLAGLSAALVHGPGRSAAGMRRGLGIWVVGYAFKLWAWTVDYSAILERRNWPAIALDTVALGLAWLATQEKRSARARLGLGVGAALAWSAMVFALANATRTPSVVLRLDVLQAIGVCLVLANALLAAVTRTKHAPLGMLALAILVALVTPSFVGLDLGWLPTRVADYVARTTADPSLAASGARFPIFPWLAYALLGASIGLGVRARPSAGAWDVPFAPSAWVALVLALVVGGLVYEPTPSAQWLLSHTEQVRNLLRLAWNASIATAFAALGALVLSRLPRLATWMLSLGRHSLVVYVVHLEIAFGLPCTPIRQTLGFGTWALGTTALTAAMVALAWGLDLREARAKQKARAATPADAPTR
ncbi:MAG: heparan-alpha-glucosaminide N-acetyltransferase domain-containing protein [Sandaracinus sp.]